MKLLAWFDAQTGWLASAQRIARAAQPRSIWRTLGWMLVATLLVAFVTGVALAFYYSPSQQAAWASVAYIEDQLPWGSMVRTMHSIATTMAVVLSGMHLAVVVWRRAYRKPNALAWWLGLLAMVVVMAIGVTGFVLRWDQSGYWAARVEIGIAASTPFVGQTVRALAQGGNELGNFTLTRFHALHTLVLPGALLLLLLGHIALIWRAGLRRLPPASAQTPPGTATQLPQMVVSAAAMLGTLGVVYGLTAWYGSIGLHAPGDATQAFDARPLWYFRWLFELRHWFGSLETVAALGVPALVLGALAALPYLDATGTRVWRARIIVVACASLVCTATALSALRDRGDSELAKRQREAGQRAAQARQLARANGVPVAGGLAVFTTAPMWRARSLYARLCADCHEGDKRKAPLIEAGYGNRQWLTDFLKAPSDDRFYGRTKLAKREEAMAPVELAPADLAAVVEWLAAQRGETTDPQKVAAGGKLIAENCNDCHSSEPWVAGASAPALAGWGSKEMQFHLLSEPGSKVQFGELNEMPRFADELSAADRELLVGYLRWLSNATPAQKAALPPL